MYWSVEGSAPAVERIWSGDSDVEPGVGHRSNPVLGSDLVFSIIDGTCSVALQGPVTRRTVYPYSSGAEYVGVRFRPGVGSIVAGLGLADLCDEAASIDALDFVDLPRLREAVLGSSSLRGRSEAVRCVVEACLPADLEPSRLVVAAIERFGRSGGRARIADVADHLGVTERHLQRQFKTYSGLSPKLAARLVRVQRVVDELQERPTADLATVAVASGFCDQAHMTNDVGRVLGVTPASLVCEQA